MTPDSKESNENFDSSLDQPDVVGETTMSAVSQPPVVLEPGEILLEKFRIIELIGRGGMGSVFRVEHLMVNRNYALKCLSKSQTTDGSWRRFQNEVKAAHMLDHPNLIRVFEFGLLPGGQPFFLMEIVDGPTLADEIKKLGSLDLDRALKIFIHVAFAIQYAHDHKVVHRDLKPSNIMLAKPHYAHEQEIVKVVDFGIAKLTGVDEFNQQTLTKTGEIFGSPLYMSPEQCMGIAVDHRSDLYSLGCVFYETLTGAPPFIGDSALSTMMKHQSDRQLSLKEASLGRQFPEQMESIISKLLEKEPDDRYQNANALAEDLIALEKSMKSDEAPAVRSTLTSAAQKLEKEKKKLSGAPNIYLMLCFGAATFVCGLVLCYLVINLQRSVPEARVNMLPMNLYSKESPEPAPTAADSTAAASSQKPYTSSVPFWATKTNKYLEFHFPSHQSLGLIEFKDGTQKVATGLVSIPLGQPYGFVPGNYLLQNPQLLAGFRADEIPILDFGGGKRINLEVFAQLKQLTGLRILNLSGTEFGDTELEYIAGLSNLKYLNLATTRVTCKALLGSPILKTVKCLDTTCLDGGKLIAREVPNLPSLTQLVLGDNNIQDEDLKFIAKSKSIKILCLAQNPVTEKGVANLIPLQTLEWLDLSQTIVDPKCCESIARIPGLKVIEVGKMFDSDSRNQFEQYLRSRKPKLKILWKNVYTSDLASALPEYPWQGHTVDPHLDLGLDKMMELPRR